MTQRATSRRVPPSTSADEETGRQAEYRATRATIDRLATTLTDAALDVAWAQWSAMGSTAATRLRARSLVDPEALVLLSLGLDERERRLTDLVHDWMAIASDLLSVQRMKNLVAAYPAAVRARLPGIARTALERGKDFRWRPLAADAVADRDVAEAIPAAQATAPAGVAKGRGNKVRAVRPSLAEPSVLLLRLRLAFGVGIKADTLGFLLGTGGAWVSVRGVAAATAYTPAAVRRAVENMAAARVIDAIADTAMHYRATPVAWTTVLDLPAGLPVWRSWNERFAFVAAFLDWAERTRGRPLSRYAFAANGRDLLEAHRAAFERERVPPWSTHTPGSDWAEIVEISVTTLVAQMREEV